MSRPVILQDPTLQWLPRLLQTTDSFFPSGAYAHSFGLEGLAELGLVTDPESFARFLREQVLPALRRMELPFARFAFDAGMDGDVARVCGLDACYGAMKGARELRDASSRIGAQRLKMLAQICPHPFLDELELNRAAGLFQTHAPIVFGVQTALNKTPLNAALASYYYQTLASIVSVALKLMRLGQSSAQLLLAEVLRDTGGAVGEALTVGERDAGWFQPVLDIASARHETAYSRIFIS